MSAATLREIRDILLQAAHEARWRPGREWEVPIYVSRAKRLHRALLRLRRVAP
jgi:hypothetical protein